MGAGLGSGPWVSCSPRWRTDHVCHHVCHHPPPILRGPAAHRRALDESSEPAIVYDGTPQLVKKEVVELRPEASAVPVTRFSWADGKKSVSVYFDVDNAEAIPDSAFAVTFTPTSVDFRFQPLSTGAAFTPWQAFVVPELSDTYVWGGVGGGWDLAACGGVAVSHPCRFCVYVRAASPTPPTVVRATVSPCR